MVRSIIVFASDSSLSLVKGSLCRPIKSESEFPLCSDMLVTETLAALCKTTIFISNKRLSAYAFNRSMDHQRVISSERYLHIDYDFIEHTNESMKWVNVICINRLK